jgi:hypothetical protein
MLKIIPILFLHQVVSKRTAKVLFNVGDDRLPYQPGTLENQSCAPSRSHVFVQYLEDVSGGRGGVAGPEELRGAVGHR